MNTYKIQNRTPDWASQSRVVHGKRLTGRALGRWSVQVLRSRSRHNGTERRHWTLFVSVGRLHGEIGTR